MNETIRAACGQFQPQFGNVQANLVRMSAMVEEAQADLIVFPELCTSGYEFRDRHEAEALALDPGGAEFHWFREIAANDRAHLVFGFPERSHQSVFNSCALIEPNGRTTIYRKIHLFDREKNLFAPGDKPPKVIDTGVGRIGMMICFDWVFPEIARSLALQGAQIICHPSNLVLTYCQRAMFARSVENGVFTMTCNRIGSEARSNRTLTFTGASQILSNRGATLAQAAPDREEVIAATLHPLEAENKMLTANNHIFNDRREDLYAGLCVERAVAGRS